MAVSLWRVVFHHAPVEYTILAEILCNSRSNKSVRNPPGAPICTTLTAAITAAATTNWLGGQAVNSGGGGSVDSIRYLAISVLHLCAIFTVFEYVNGTFTLKVKDWAVSLP